MSTKIDEMNYVRHAKGNIYYEVDADVWNCLSPDEQSIFEWGVISFGYLLNTEEHRNKTVSFSDFADIVWVRCVNQKSERFVRILFDIDRRKS